MEGDFFYFIMWSLVIYLQFFYKKKRKEQGNQWTIYLFLLIIAHPFQLTLYNRNVHLSFFILITGVILYISTYYKNQKRSYLLQTFCLSFTICIYQIMAIYDPVWTVPYALIIYLFMTVTMAYLLGKTKNVRYLILVSGTLLSEVLLSILLGKYGLYNEIGSSEMNIRLLISIIFFVFLETISIKISEYVRRRKSERNEIQ